MSAKTTAVESAKKSLPKNVTVATVAKDEAPAQQSKQMGNLKQTPELPMDFATKLNALKRLEQINCNLDKLEGTKKLLDAFKLEESNNTSSQPYLMLRDSGYGSTNEFKTYNVGIIKGVIDFIGQDVDAKIQFVKKQIAEFELPRI